jgi:probable rRNA maturation factor
VLTNTLRARPPRLPFGRIKDAALGARYALSLVFVGDAHSRRLNRRYRAADRPANVLAFGLAPDEGEIFLNPRAARRDAPRFGVAAEAFIGRLFIHGLLHLKGHRHGGTMERTERALRRRFHIA